MFRDAVVTVDQSDEVAMNTAVPSQGSYYAGSCLISSRGKTKGAASRAPSASSTRVPSEAAESGREDRNKCVESADGRRRLSHAEKRTPSTVVEAPRGRSSDGTGGWAGGVPLISVASPRRSGLPAPLRLRLAFHARGAPLILSSRGKGEGECGGGWPSPRALDADSGGRRKARGGRALASDLAVPPDKGGSPATASDNPSVASDEGGSSVNSESGLPRIIKPRKRRKKERKPAKAREGEEAPESPVAPSEVEARLPLDVLPSGAIESAIEYSGATGERSDAAAEESPTSSCHCRLCDPAGFIWDVDRSCYSPFLTPLPSLSTDSPYRSLFARPAPGACSPESPVLRPGRDPSDPRGGVWVEERVGEVGGGVRNGWSEVGTPRGKAVVDVAEEDPSYGGNVWSGRNLEVSTEIITSPNGHRDLEIKFYSTLSSTLKEVDVGKKSYSPGRLWNVSPFDLTAEE